MAQTRQVLNLVRRLAERDLAVAIVTHNLHDVFEVADRITVLRLGQRVALFEREKTTQQEVVHAITAGKLDHVPGMEAGAPAEVAAEAEAGGRSRHELRPHCRARRARSGGPPVDERHESETLSGYVRLWWQGCGPASWGRSRSSSAWS